MNRRVARICGIALLIVAPKCPSEDSARSATYWRIRGVRVAIATFEAREGRLPAVLDEICPVEEPCPLMPPGESLADAWGEAFHYRRTGSDQYVLISTGPDRLLDTADDLQFSVADERELVARVHGCYQVDFSWWSDFPGSTLTLDTSSVLAGRHPANPTPTGYFAGAWIVRLPDTVEVTWSLGEIVSRLKLVPTDQGLVGHASVVNRRSRRVVADRVSCSQRDSAPPAATESDEAGSGTAVTVESTAKLDSLARQWGYHLRGVAAIDGPYYAVIAGRGTTPPNDLLVVKQVGDTFELVQELLALGWNEPTVVRWISTQGRRSLVVSLDDRIEGGVMTTVYVVDEDSLVATFQDANACRPAELHDVDGDGSLELLSFEEDRSNLDCIHPCYLVLDDEFGMVPAWVRVRRWDAGAWVPSEGSYPGFYSQLAARYEDVERWVQTSDQGAACRDAPWFLQQPGLFGDWARRARQVAR